MIKEIQERRTTQAQLRQASNDDAWEEADHARYRANAEWDKARASLEVAALQARRELTEAQHLPMIADSLNSSALEDVNRARAINEDLVRLGRESFSLLGESNISDEASPENFLLPEPAAGQLEAQPLSEDVVPDAPPVFAEVEATPATTVSKPQVLQERPEPPEVTQTVESPPISAAEALRREMEATPVTNVSEPQVLQERPEPPEVTQTVESPPISAAEALRREMEEAASATSPQAFGTQPSGGGMDVPAPDVPAGPVSLVEELERGLEASRTISASTVPPDVAVEPPAAAEARPAEAPDDRLQTVAQDLTFQPDVKESTASPTRGTQQEPSGPLAESYSGRLYLMFPSSLGQNELETVWEVLDEVAGSGAIVDNRLVSQEAGIQFTLELRDKVLSTDQLRNRMPGAGLIALSEDRVKVDWPSRA